MAPDPPAPISSRSPCRTLGSQSTPNLATSLYNLILLTGQASTIEVDVSATPTSMDGATITDASDWSIAESGDAIFLSSLGGNGIGGCAFAAAVNGIGQFVAIAPGNTVDGCSADICEVTPIVVTPEPSTIALALTGLVGLAGVRSRRRSHRDTLTTINGEA